MKPNCEDHNYDLTILPVRKDTHGIRIRRPTHPILPNVHEGANLLICSSVRSGKSNLLCNLLLNSNFLKECFNDVYIFSSTIHQDATARRLRDAFPDTVYDSFDERKLQRIIDTQKSYPDDERPAIAIILDDLQGIKPKSLFYTLSSNFRHYGIGLLAYTIQNFKMVPPVVRSNATNLLIGTNNSQQMKQMASEYAEAYGGEDNFMKYHRLAVPARYSFMYCRLDQYPAKLHRNFEEQPLFEAEL